MILVKTPLRISFVGGYTDYEEFYTKYPGRVISSTIDKSVYIAISKKFSGDIRVSYSHTENVLTSAEVQHTRVRNILQKLGIEKGIEIVSIADLPSKGIGLSSSSAFTIGLLKGLNRFLGNSTYSEYLARESYEIEKKEGAGKQDQYTISYGGLNMIDFNKDGMVKVHPIHLSSKTKNDFEKHLMFFYTAKTREAKNLLEVSKTRIVDNFETLKKISDAVPVFLERLEKEDFKGIGSLLSEMWELKKGLAPGISDEEIDRMYNLGITNGAWGGRLMGAGGGGFMMLIVPPHNQSKVRKALAEWREVDIKLTNHGSEIVYETVS